jgi:pilus assembly protein CpaB
MSWGPVLATLGNRGTVNRRLIGLIVAVLLAAVATVLLIQYVRSADERARQDETLAEVFVAQSDIQPGISADDAIAQGLIARDEVPARAVPSGAVADLGQISGQLVTVPIYEGEVIVSQRFGQTVAQSTGLLEVPPGTQAVTIEASIAPGLAGFIQPGNLVSVVGTLEITEEAPPGDEDEPAPSVAAGTTTQYLIQNATVLAVGQRVVTVEVEGGSDVQQSDDRYLFTLAMPPEDIEQVVFGTQQGTLWFTLVPEPEEDQEAEVFDTPGRTLSNIFE